MPESHDIARLLSETFRPVGVALLRLGDHHQWATLPGSPAAEEASTAIARWSPEEIERLRNPVSLVAAAVFPRIIQTADYLRSIAVLAGQADEEGVRLDYAAVVTARAVLESMAYTWWLAEPDIGGPERSRRLAVEVLRDLANKKGTVSAIPTLDVDLTEDIETFIEMCRTYGVPVDPPAARSDDSSAPLPKLPGGGKRPTAFELISSMLPSQEHPRLGAVIYYLLSNTAHASVQGLLGSANVGADSGGDLRITFSRATLLGQVAPVLWCLPTPIRAVHDYFGWDPARFRATFAEAAERLSEWMPRGDPGSGAQAGRPDRPR